LWQAFTNEESSPFFSQRNSILVLKRHINKSSTDGDDLDTQKGRRWQLSMVLSDSLYDPALGNMERRVRLSVVVVLPTTEGHVGIAALKLILNHSVNAWMDKSVL
jgi:hypothetical protein